MWARRPRSNFHALSGTEFALSPADPRLVAPVSCVLFPRFGVFAFVPVLLRVRFVRVGLRAISAFSRSTEARSFFLLIMFSIE